MRGSGREDCNDGAVCIEYSGGSREAFIIIRKKLSSGAFLKMLRGEN